MIILLDCDGVIGHFTAGARQWVREERGLNFTDEELTNYDLMASFGLAGEWAPFRAWLSARRFCRTMPTYDGAREFVKALRKLGDVVVVTSPFVSVDHWEQDRRDWLADHFGFSHKDVISCHRKELVRGHVLIDDKIENCEAFVSKSSYRQAVVFDRPWNRGVKLGTAGAMVRAQSYAEVLRVLGESQANGADARAAT